MRNVTFLVMALIFAGEAFGATGYNATLAQPLTETKSLVIYDNLFRCDGSVCTLVSHPTSSIGDPRTCRALQRKVGTLTAYVVDGRPFDATKLAKCNAAD
ncbi:MAG: CC_3452 family protein [Steroidobacteraceae bacterium]